MGSNIVRTLSYCWEHVKHVWQALLIMVIIIGTLSAQACLTAEIRYGDFNSEGEINTMGNSATNLDILARKLQDPFLEELYSRTYKSIIDRVEKDGYFPESVNGGYIGMFPRTVGGLVSLFAETGEWEKARKAVDVVLKATKANNMHRCPHVMGRKQIENIPYSDNDDIISMGHSIPLYRLDSGYAGAQKFTAKDKPIYAIETWISARQDAKTDIICTISESLGDDEGIASVEVPLISASEFGKWMRFQFKEPVHLISWRSYYIRIRSNGNINCVWWGDVANDDKLGCAYGYDAALGRWYENESHVAAFAVDMGGIKHKKASFYPIICRMDQVDGNFHVLAAWATVVLNCDVKKWEDATYSEIVDLTNTAIDFPYLFPEVDGTWPGLMHNFCFEHSREGRFWDTWDLLTQSWACQGLRLLEKVAIRRGDTENAVKWRNAYTQIEKAVLSKLTMEIDGKTVYAEMRLPNGGDGVLFGGLSWVNLSPIQAQWAGADPEILKNTVHAYRNRARIDWHGRVVTGVQWTPDNECGDPQVIGKGVGWDIVYALQEKDYGVIINWLDFIKDENYTELYAEAYNLIDGKTVIQDPGNGEQTSWWCWGIAKARKAAGLPAVP